MSATGSLSREAYLATGIPLIVVCAGFVTVRCLMSIRGVRKLVIDDYFSIVALLLVIVAFSLNDVIIRLIIAFMLWTTKAPILVVYVKLFGVKKWIVHSCYAGLALSGAAYMCAMAPTFLRCHPGTDDTTMLHLGHCVTGTTLTGVISGFVALVQDMVILVLPMPCIYNLHLAPGKKLAVGAVFCSGFLAIAASVVSLYFKFRAYRGERSDTLATMLCA
ncbi:hypothetical protein DCS_02393 [Drechmeria coniospora]|uniref:Rhodopsin domain-containing protein n=1 Tax=Drechmeria coniospora TaxID=98403 RepID=A0A151GW05_DRECN|nr:hypothetical protein DCS_02393 [Drechmeria coniospora]KYK61251.1 hypothetical protein DCS_02393 [Drechmeria coniospora]